MKRIRTMLFLGTIILGGAMVLSGLVWAEWHQSDAPPPLVENRLGAVVFAETANPTQMIHPTDEPSATPSPTEFIFPVEHIKNIRAFASPATSDSGAAIAAYPTASPVPSPTTKPSPRPTARPQVAPTVAPTATPEPASEPPTRIVAPSIHLDVKVVQMSWKTHTQGGKPVSEWVVPKNAAGWHINSALPGMAGNTVISGHNNVEGEVFRYISDLKMGDKITLYAGGKTYDYYVQEKYILKEAGEPQSVREENAEWIAHKDDVRLTLVTCWPYQWPGNTHRVIVVARP